MVCCGLAAAQAYAELRENWKFLKSEAWSAAEQWELKWGKRADWLVGYGRQQPHGNQPRKKTSAPHSVIEFPLLFICEINETNEESKWNGAAPNQTKRRNELLSLAASEFSLVGYGRWPSCSAPTHKSTHYSFIDLFGLLALSFFLHPINQRSELVDWKDGRRELIDEAAHALPLSSFWCGAQPTTKEE